MSKLSKYVLDPLARALKLAVKAEAHEALDRVLKLIEEEMPEPAAVVEQISAMPIVAEALEEIPAEWRAKAQEYARRVLATEEQILIAYLEKVVAKVEAEL